MSNEYLHEYDRLFMADPLVIVAELLAPAFAAVAGGDEAVDPVVRPSDRADAQANGALALAKQLGRKPRDVAEDVVAASDLTGKATLEVAGPGFINVTFDESFLKDQLAMLVADERLGVRTRGVQRASGRRLLGAQHRQGDAHRASAHHGDR